MYALTIGMCVYFAWWCISLVSIQHTAYLEYTSSASEPQYARVLSKYSCSSMSSSSINIATR